MLFLTADVIASQFCRISLSDDNVKKLIAVSILLLCGSALAEVVIDRKSVAPTSCPQPEPVMIKNPDGSYSKPWPNTITLQMCWEARVWKEVWTDLPEKGGKFVSDVKGPEKAISPF